MRGGRLQVGDRIGQLYRRDGFAQAKACAIRVGEGSCLLRIFVNNNNRWQLLRAAMNGAQQYHPTAIFIESHDSDIQLTLSSANNLQRLLGSLCDEENRAGVPKRLPDSLLEVVVARVEKNEPCESWIRERCQSRFH